MGTPSTLSTVRKAFNVLEIIADAKTGYTPMAALNIVLPRSTSIDEIKNIYIPKLINAQNNIAHQMG
jgi:hypothetical protein